MRPTAAPVGRSHGSRSRCSMTRSRSSSSLTPPRARNLIPLSGIGLWLAEIITPRSAPSAAVRWATPGVGRTPSRRTSTPAEARPAVTAASRNSPDNRVSRPTTATGRWPANSPASPRTCAAATDRSSASSAVSRPLASPRTPSVPKTRVGASTADPTRGSALAVLRRLAGLLQPGLLALDDAGVTGEQAGLLQRRPVGVDVDRVQRAGDPEAQRTGLAGDPAAVDPGDDVEAAHEVGGHERLVDDLLVQLVGEVRLQRAAVDRPLPGARDEPDPRHGLLAAAGCAGGRDRGR